MNRRIRQSSGKVLLLTIVALVGVQSALASTVVVPSDDDLIIGARAIVRGKITAVEAGYDPEKKAIFTYVTVKIQEVFKGEILSKKIVLRQPGGEVGDLSSVIFGAPEFKKKEKVLLYLDTWPDGSFRVYQMFLGKYSITNDPFTGRRMVVRDSEREGVHIMHGHDHGEAGHAVATEQMELSAFREMLRERLVATAEHSEIHERTYYDQVPMLIEPPEYSSMSADGGIRPAFTFLNPSNPSRWFEPDTGDTVFFKVNPSGAPFSNIHDDMTAAMNAWSSVDGSAIRLAYGGSTTACGLLTTNGENTIFFNNCDGFFASSPSCSGVLAAAGIVNVSSQTRIINGVTFRKALEGNVSFNPFASCFFTSRCNVQEVATHEIGHAIGLGHSEFGDATMAAFAHFDGRCAGLRQDDRDGMVFIYPGTGGALTITTGSTLPSATVNTSYSQTLTATGGTPGYTWNLQSGSLPSGLSLSSAGVISGTPTVTGTFGFSIRVTDSQQATATKSFSLTVSTGGAALDSQFVSQTVPTNVSPGQIFSVNMKWLNTGTTTWSGSNYYLVTQNPPFNPTWGGSSGGNAVSLSAFTIVPGQQLDVNFSVTAPTTPGSYNFQWQTYEHNGAGFFGQMSTNVVIQVGSGDGGGTDDASFVSQSVPTLLVTGQQVSVSVTMQNTGTTTWSAASGYRLGSQNPTDNTTWGLNRVNVSGSVAAGAQTIFTFNITAPQVAGTYNFQWRMLKDGSGFFGGTSTNVAVSVVTPTTDTDGDAIPDVVEVVEGTNRFVKDNDVFNNARLFVMQQYRDFLGREGDSSGIVFWTNRIESGASTRSQVIEDFFNSAEFQGSTAPVTRLYFAYFLRIPDTDGLNFWVNAFKNGTSLDSISQSFAQSQEFNDTYGSLTNSEFVILVYNNVLEREPDAGGLAFWTQQLDSGQLNRGQVMLGFSESQEYRTRSFNKVYVTQIYIGMLRRSPDQGGFDFWVAQMDAGHSGLSLIGGFLVSPEYRNRFLP